MFLSNADVLRFLGRVGVCSLCHKVQCLDRRGQMASVIPIKITPQILFVFAGIVLVVGYSIGSYYGALSVKKEGFENGTLTICGRCQKKRSTCGCPYAGSSSSGSSSRSGSVSATQIVCPPCTQPDMSRYVLKTTIPPCPSMPNMSQYMLKTECPPVPDLSKYVLKSSIPKQQPVIIDNSACKKEAGECPPCPRTRCPEVKCPAPTICPPPAPCPRAVCPPTTVKCKAEGGTPESTVRPYLAPLDVSRFGM